MNNILKISNEVYSKLADEQSKELYVWRMAYSLTGDEKYARKISMSGKNACKLKKKLESYKSKKIYLYGAGIRGKNLTYSFGYYFTAVIDKNEALHGALINGVKIIGVDDVDKSNCIIIIPNKGMAEEIAKELIIEGFAPQDIIRFDEAYTEQMEAQYFDLEELPHSDVETFIDCGAYDGATSLLFTKWCNGNYDSIYCFEPDADNANRCEKLFERNEIGKTHVIRKGTWNENATLHFRSSADVASHICEDSDEKIEVSTIDSEITINRNDRISFIKMDIEGAELESLMGAEEVIKRDKPILAISIYHKADDIFKIPEYIISLKCGYKLYLRHYSFNTWDTILYAVSQSEDK